MNNPLEVLRQWVKDLGAGWAGSRSIHIEGSSGNGMASGAGRRGFELDLEVSRWGRISSELEELGKEWATVLHREVKWKMAYDRTLALNELRYGVSLIQDTDWEKRIRAGLPPELRNLVFRIDIATQDPRPENPFAMGKKQIYIFEPSSGDITKESLAELFEFIPSKIVQFRVFALDHEHDQLLADLAENSLRALSPAPKKSV